MSIITDLSPPDLGFDSSRFPSYRGIQYEALEWIAESFESYRFVMSCIPQGGGKSLNAMTMARLFGWRAGVLTVTKGLMDQYNRDGKPVGMVDIRGRNNYDCTDFANLDCRSGAAMGCRYVRGGGCSYDRAKCAARNAPLFSTNYDFWMNVNDKATGLERSEKEAEWKGENPVELLILDEAHDAPEKLSKYISCHVMESEVRKFGDWPKGEVLLEWSKFAVEMLGPLEDEIDTTKQELIHITNTKGRQAVTKQHVDILHRLESLYDRLFRVSKAVGEDWIVEKREGTKYGRLWQFDCIFPGMFAEQYLFCGVPRVLLMTATGKPKTMGLLGVKREDFAYRAWRRVFPAQRHPIYMPLCPQTDEKTGNAKVNAQGRPLHVRVDRGTSKHDIQTLIDWMDDEIITPRLDRKGLIQTVAYERQRQILDMSKYAAYMLGNTDDPDSDSAQKVAEDYRKAKPPALLVSPSFTTGWDFPYEQCEYIILFKLPLLPLVDKVIKARVKRDPQYADFRTMQVTEQGCGRGMRHEDDFCEVFLIDGHFEWFLYKNRGLAQDWFVKAIRKVDQVPKPPKALWKGRTIS